MIRSAARTRSSIPIGKSPRACSEGGGCSSSRLLMATALVLLPFAARAEDRDREHREKEVREHKGEEKPASADDLLYALGALLGHRIANHTFTPREMELVAGASPTPQ